MVVTGWMWFIEHVLVRAYRFLVQFLIVQLYLVVPLLIQRYVQGGTFGERLVVSIPLIAAGQLIQWHLSRRRKRNGANEAREEGQVSEEDVWYQCGRMGIPLADTRAYVRYLRGEAQNPGRRP